MAVQLRWPNPTLRGFLSALTFGLCLVLLNTSSGRAYPLWQDRPVGPIGALAIDDTNAGWAWAAPAPDRPGINYLLRIQGGKTVVVADTSTDADLLPPGLQLTRMVLTSDGRRGWAIGQIGGNGQSVLWQMQGTTWKRVPFAGSVRLIDITITAEGFDGWLTGQSGGSQGPYVLFRLRDGQWLVAPDKVPGSLIRVALSPKGTTGWAAGQARDRTPAIFQLDGGGWQPVEGGKALAEGLPVSITADDLGNGWAIGGLTASQRISPLLRLTRAKGAVAVQIDSLPTFLGTQLALRRVAVNNGGIGWLVGSFIEAGKPLQIALFRLKDETVQYIASGSVGLPGAGEIDPTALAVSPVADYSWLGATNRQGFGQVYPLSGTSECTWPCSQPQPVTTLPAELLGSPTECSTATCPYCLHGAFARFWEANEGQQRLGLPYTAPIYQTLGGTRYIVQYTQRARLEWHPGYGVQLGLLGNPISDQRRDVSHEPAFQPMPTPVASPPPTCRFVPETSHYLCGNFRTYYTSLGASAVTVLGYPRSEQFTEYLLVANVPQPFTVQYFQRQRLEHHPENAGTIYEFQYGFYGVESFQTLQATLGGTCPNPSTPAP